MKNLNYKTTVLTSVSTNGITHYVWRGYYLCNRAVGRIKPNLKNNGRLCKNCKGNLKK